MVDFQCPHCNAIFPLRQEDLGDEGICKNCGNTIRLVPTGATSDGNLVPTECAQITADVSVDQPRWYQLSIWQLIALTFATAIAITTSSLMADDQFSKLIIGGYIISLIVYLILILPAIRARRNAAKSRLEKIQQYRKQAADRV